MYMLSKEKIITFFNEIAINTTAINKMYMLSKETILILPLHLLQYFLPVSDIL